MKPLEYLDLIRKLPCLICGQDSEIHHLDPIGMGRNRTRQLSEHFTAIPLCRKHHAEFHSRGIGIFDVKYDINSWHEAHRLLVSLVIE